MGLKILNSLSVRQKVWGGFGVLVALLVLVSALSYRSLFRVEDRLSLVVDELQPAMLASMDLSASVDEAAAALGFYLVSQEAKDKTRYGNALQRVNTALGRLDHLLVADRAPQARAQLDTLRAQVERFVAYRERMIGLVENPASNIAGLRYAAEHLNPLSQQMLQLASQMILSEFDEPVSEERRQLLNIIHNLRYAWANVMNGVRAYIAFRGERPLQEIDLYLGSLQSSLDALVQFENELTLDQEDSLSQFTELRDRFKTNFEELRKIESSGRWRMDMYLLRNEIGPLVNSIQTGLDGIVAGQRRQAEHTSTALLGSLQGDARFIGLLALLGLLLGGGVALVAGNQIAGPVVALRDLLKDIAEGEADLARRVKLASDDELGQASTYFNQTMARLQEMIRGVASASSEVEQQVLRSSANISQAKDNVVEGAEHTRSTATATEEMSATSAEIARNAQAASAEADQARRQAQAGKEAMQSMASRAREMDREIAGLQQNVDSILDKGQSMYGMIGAINEIADQTNLLALNAAIEAARAGEAGRGFAVVADEVRQLAIKTQASTAQITELLNDNQRSNQALVSSMRKVAETTDSTLQTVAEAEAVIEQMAGNVGQMNDMIEQIAGAAKEQAQVSHDIAGSIEILSAKEGENAELMDESNAAFGSLSQTANRLHTMVARFKV